MRLVDKILMDIKKELKVELNMIKVILTISKSLANMHLIMLHLHINGRFNGVFIFYLQGESVLKFLEGQLAERQKATQTS